MADPFGLLVVTQPFVGELCSPWDFGSPCPYLLVAGPSSPLADDA